MKQLTQKQIDKLNKVAVHCTMPDKDDPNNYVHKSIQLGLLVDSIIELINEEKTPRKKKETTNDK